MIPEIVIQVDDNEEKALYEQSDGLSYGITKRHNQSWKVYFTENMRIRDKGIHGSGKAIRKKRPDYTSRQVK